MGIPETFQEISARDIFLQLARYLCMNHTTGLNQSLLVCVTCRIVIRSRDDEHAVLPQIHPRFNRPPISG